MRQIQDKGVTELCGNARTEEEKLPKRTYAEVSEKKEKHFDQANSALGVHHDEENEALRGRNSMVGPIQDLRSDRAVKIGRKIFARYEFMEMTDGVYRCHQF
jgi:hypothetical protein